MDVKVFAETVDPKALNQIYTLVKQPAFEECKVRIMPDVHAGAGCVIGFTADLGDKVIPNIVGVDIGCGMYTIDFGNIDIDFNELDRVIRKYVPAGMNVQEEYVGFPFYDLTDLYCFKNLKNVEWIRNSIGTLGGGNHFIEVDVDDKGNKYLVIHTGSRNLGKQVCEYYQNIAIDNLLGKGRLKKDIDELIKRYKEEGKEKEIGKEIARLKNNNKYGNGIPKDLCYLEGDFREMYLHDMKICQKFAQRNREVIGNIISKKMMWGPGIGFETVHNYIDHDSNIVRKGAISARKGEEVLIPINMRDGCIIGVGKGNDDWNCSAPHGAGRIMSRRQAKENISIEEYEKSMEGIFTTSVDYSTIDESPMAYKSMDEIVRCIEDTVEIKKIIKPLYNFKAGD